MSHVVERMEVKKHQDFTDTKSTKGVASLDRRAPDLGKSPQVP